MEQVKTVKQKLYSMEKKCEDASKTGKDTTSSDSSASSSIFSMTTPHGVEVSPSNNGVKGVDAEVVLEGVQIQREVTFSLVKRKETKRMTHLVILNQIRKIRKSPHSGAN